MTGNVMAEDPLCTHTPGTFPPTVLRSVDVAGEIPDGLRTVGVAGAVDGGQRGSAERARNFQATAIEYGAKSQTTIEWDDAAAARMKKIPVFVRGMVVKAVEESCRRSGFDRVTVEELDRIRARMPTPKIFG